MNWLPIQEGVAILQVTLCYRNWDKLRLDGPHGSRADVNLFPSKMLIMHMWISQDNCSVLILLLSCLAIFSLTL